MLQGSAVGGKVAPFLASFNDNRKGVKKGEEAIKFHGSTDNVPQTWRNPLSKRFNRYNLFPYRSIKFEKL